MKRVLIKLIDLYQMMPLDAHKYCRFRPTCSEYMKESITRYGVYKGVKLGIKRLLKCHPNGEFGYDPLKENL